VVAKQKGELQHTLNGREARHVTAPSGRGRARWYQITGVDGEPYPSVTMVTGSLEKGFLLPWTSKMIREANAEELGVYAEHGRVLTPLSLQMILDRTKHAAKNYAMKSADRGTRAHEVIESLLADAEPLHDDDLSPYIEGFKAWRTRFKPEIVATETVVYSDQYGYAGRADVVFRLDGVLYVGDWKTGKGLYPDMAIQASAYAKAIAEMTGEECRAAIISLGPEAGKGFWAHNEVNVEAAFPGFTGALRAFWALRTKNLFTPVK
jgi:hypothetical protein